MTKYALITGGELRNRGAQAMTFRTVAAVRVLLPELEPVLASDSDAPPTFVDKIRGEAPRPDQDNLAFNIIKNPFNRNVPSHDSLKTRSKIVAKRLINARTYREATEILNHTAICLDISGFFLGAQWGFEKCQLYLNMLSELRKRDIPTYLLPQSFGPFDFGNQEQNEIFASHAADLLSYPRLICARETQGLKDILAMCSNARCKRVDDIVLAGADIPLEKVFRDPASIPAQPGIITQGNVGIIPSARTFEQGDEIEILALWGCVVEELLDCGYNVYVIRHSEDDQARCEQVKALFQDDKRVVLLDQERYCFQYEELFEHCDFLVASRFHAIVHAYRCGTPCVVLGWAEKYKELIETFGQQVFAHDVRELKPIEAEAVIESVRSMSSDHRRQSEIIQRVLGQIMLSSNAFQLAAEDFQHLRT